MFNEMHWRCVLLRKKAKNNLFYQGTGVVSLNEGRSFLFGFVMLCTAKSIESDIAFSVIDENIDGKGKSRTDTQQC